MKTLLVILFAVSVGVGQEKDTLYFDGYKLPLNFTPVDSFTNVWVFPPSPVLLELLYWWDEYKRECYNDSLVISSSDIVGVQDSTETCLTFECMLEHTRWKLKHTSRVDRKQPDIFDFLDNYLRKQVKK